MAAPFVDQQQMALPGLSPQIGERWRNQHTGTIVTVLALNQRHYNWLTIRVNGSEQIVALANFLKNFQRI